MTELARYAGSLKRQIRMIKSRINDTKRCYDKAKSLRKRADSYYNSYRSTRSRSSRNSYYASYREYTNLGRIKEKEGRKISVIVKELIKDYQENVVQISIIVEGRDSHIQNLKRNIAKQSVLLEKSKKAKSDHKLDVLAVYARGNYALLAGVIASVRKGVDADSKSLLDSLSEINDGANKHADRLITAYSDSYIETNESFEVIKEVNLIEQGSVISSIGNLVESKVRTYSDILKGDTDKLIEVLGFSALAGLTLNSSYNKVASLWNKK